MAAARPGYAQRLSQRRRELRQPASYRDDYAAGHGGCRTCSNGDCQYRFYGQPDLFYNYYAWPSCTGVGAELYVSPRPVPPHVGHTYITYQPLMPHEFLYDAPPHVSPLLQRRPGPEPHARQVVPRSVVMKPAGSMHSAERPSRRNESRHQNVHPQESLESRENASSHAAGRGACCSVHRYSVASLGGHAVALQSRPPGAAGRSHRPLLRQPAAVARQLCLHAVGHAGRSGRAAQLPRCTRARAGASGSPKWSRSITSSTATIPAKWRPSGFPFQTTPYWPSHTDQFGVYPVRGPW